MSETSHVALRGIPPRLKGRIARAVKDEQRNMNDVLTKILANHYGVEHEPTTQGRVREVGASSQILLELPQPLRDAIELDAFASGDSLRNTIVRVISDAMNVPYVATGRWTAVSRRTATRRPSKT